MRAKPALVVAVVIWICCIQSWAVDVEQSDEAVSLSNDVCVLQVDTTKGSAPVRLGMPESEQPLLSSMHLSLYFSEGKQWVSELWMKPEDVRVEALDGAQSITTDTKSFGGFDLRRTVTLRDDSPVIQVRYHLVAQKDTKPHLIVPINIHTSAGADRVVTPGGPIDAADIEVSNFAMEMKSKWYAFTSAETGRGVAVAPIQTTSLYTKPFIQHREDGSLGLAWRIHPMKTFAGGEDVSFAYNVAVFEGDAAEAAQTALQAGAGPIAQLPTPQPKTDDEDAAQWLPVAYCPTVTTTPAVDGQLDDPCWDDAGQIGRFMLIKGDDYPDADTTGSVMLCEGVLYLALKCEEPVMSDLQTNAQPGSDQVWTDDAVEVFIDADGDGKNYAHLIANASGVQQDNLRAERGVQYQWKAETHQGEDLWNVEMAVPLTDLAVDSPGPGATWRFNLCRSRHPHSELSCWSPTIQGFHRPEHFGCLVFGDPPVRVTGVRTGLQEKEAERALVLDLDESSTQGQRVSAELDVMREGQQIDRGAYEGTVTADLNTIRVPYSIEAPGQYALQVNVTADDNTPMMQAVFAGTVYSRGLASAIYPAEEDANSLYIAKGTAQHLFFVPANHSEKDYEQFDFVLLLPEGIEVYDGVGGHLSLYYNATLQETSQVERDGHTMTRWVWRSSKSMGHRDITETRFFRSWTPILKVEGDLPEGEYPWAFYIHSGDDREHEHSGELTVLPPLEGRQPQELTVGMACWTLDASFRFWEDLLDTYRQAGLNMAESHMNRDEDKWSDAARSRGLAPWDAMWWFWWNDEYREAHPEHAAVKFDGTKDERIICPKIMAGEDEEPIAGLMKGIVEDFRAGRIEGSWHDLEGPGAFNVCFCERCLNRFRDFADISEDEELTPAKIRARYADEWVEMACQQTVEVLDRMKQYARQHGAEEWKLGIYSAVQSENTRRRYRVDWRTVTPVIDVATPSFYSTSAGDLTKSFVHGNQEFLSLVKGIRDMPVWNALTTGPGRGRHYMEDGRILKMQVIKSVAFGADGTIQWWWGPVDGRHYRGYANATKIIAANERFFVEGTMREDLLAGEEVPGTSRIAWELGDEVLVMLFNDSTETEQTITAQIPEGMTIAGDDGRAEAGVQNGVLSAPAGPLDCRWFVLQKQERIRTGLTPASCTSFALWECGGFLRLIRSGATFASYCPGWLARQLPSHL